jgi:hypothetical protein
MDSALTPFPTRATRLGFHYYPDTLHYRDSDLQAWLPRLSALGASWLILKATPDRAIPEHFLTSLLQHGIEPILHYDLPLLNPPDPADLRPVLSAYAHWGVHSVIWFDRPNAWQSWTSCGWGQSDLVGRFLDRFIPYAAVTQQSGLNPLFPPLQPGGSYWDTSFLRTALQSLARRKQTHFLDHLVLSAYAWTHARPMNWGAGGPDCWPAARPYGLPSPYEDERESQDQCGFRIYDWYQAIAEAETGHRCPIVLLGAGVASDPLDRNALPQSNQDHTRTNLAIARLLAGADAAEPADPATVLTPLADEVISCNLWLLAAASGSRFENQAWFTDSGCLPVVDSMRAWYVLPHKKTAPKPAEKPLRKDYQPGKDNAQARINGHHPIHHYLLLPTYDFGVADWHLNVIKPFIKKHQATVGFSLAEAALAARVTVIGGEQSIPEETLEKLRQAGSIVERINGDGTSIATQLAER